MSTASSLTTASATNSLRRNGKLASCEPCRKSKLSCDHVSPICRRCQRRRQPGRYVYHPAPMTSKILQRRSRSKDHSESTKGADGEVLGNENSITLQDPPNESVEVPPATAGFLGSTSFLDAFNDGRSDKIDVMHRSSNANISGSSASTKTLSRDSRRRRGPCCAAVNVKTHEES